MGKLGGSDWVAARGERWCAQLSGLESTFAPVDEPLIHALRLAGPARIAEIGCGGGGTAIELLRRAPAGSVVHGFDISPDLIAAARGRLRADEQAIGFDVADVSAATPERPYDRLVSRFGVMFFDDPLAAFTNLTRWLAPGGLFAFAVWGPLSDNPWIAAAHEAVARVVALPRTDPDAPGPFRYGERDSLLALLARAGFSGLEVRDWRGSLALGGGLPAAEATDFALASFSSFGELLARAGDEARDEARRSLTGHLSGRLQDGVVRMDACVRIFTGARR